MAGRRSAGLGLISGTFSTVLITLGAPRIGRSRAIDWMDIGTVLLGLDGIRSEPGPREIAAGVLVHQSADLAWAIAFFALGRAWTLSLTPQMLMVVAAPWALATSAIEYYLLLPWLQPLVPLQVPYWTALMVHVTSAAAYPLFPWIRTRVAGERDVSSARWATPTAVVLIAVVIPLTAVDALGGTVREPRWPFTDVKSRDFDRTFMQQMTAHHEAGVEMARLVLDRAIRPETEALAHLIIAEQTREMSLLRNWWRSWFGSLLPPLSLYDRASVHGMPSDDGLRRLRGLRGVEAERAFLALMIAHHQAAVAMADEAWDRAGDPRLRIFAYSVRHAQAGQTHWMESLQSSDAARDVRPRRPSLRS